MMAIARALLLTIAHSAIVFAYSCYQPPTLCSRLHPGMIAFVGRPMPSPQLEKQRTRTTFKIEERLWGVPPLDSISVEGTRPSPATPQKSWLVLAAQRTDRAAANGVTYFIGSELCSHGLVLPLDHAWAKEFRDNVAQRKPAAMNLEVASNFVALAGFKLQLRGSGYSWQGESATPLRLPPGEYAVDFEMAHFTLPEERRSVSILPGACTTLQVQAEPDSSISGWIDDPRGVSAQGLLYLIEGEVDTSFWDSPLVALRRSSHRILGWGGPPAQRTSYGVTPGSDGRFQVRVLPGKYRLSATSTDSHDYVSPPPIPRTYFPGVTEIARAGEIVVPAGGVVRSIAFRFPDYGPTRRLEVVLAHEDGSPVSNEVVAHTGKHPGDPYRTAGWTQKLTDAHGRAAFEVWQSLEYDLHISGNVSGDSLRIAAGPEPISRKFVVHRFRRMARARRCARV